MDARAFTIILFRFLIRTYQRLHAGTPRRCRFYPTCSDYMLDALEAKGLLAGLGTGMLRILKCHPWHSGGYDPIQQTTSSPAVVGGGTKH